jgi:acylphosphatase
MKNLKVSIYGRVQGVSFRFKTKKKALELNVFGFVKNNSDGSVYLEAEGEYDNLIKLLEWCHEGPSLARVDRVEHEFSPKLKKFKNFEIKF